jgi:Lipocalin-like domain
MPDTAALLGTWKMISWKREVLATGVTSDVMGPDPVGYINYGADGRVYALVVRKDRPPPTATPPRDEEKLRLYDGMLAYAGTYTLDDEKAVHHVDASWNQSWTGTDQVRFYKLDGDRLTISAAPSQDPLIGQDVVLRMQFRKVHGAP